jgi:hypothetical protein
MFRSHRLVIALAVLVVIFPAAAQACSQCLCGLPFPADALGGATPQQLRFGLEDRYLSKSNALEDAPGLEIEHEHRVAGFALWRASDRLALLGRLPYNMKEIRAAAVGEAATRQTENGLGDAEAMALVGLMRGEGMHPSTLAAVLGVVAPTGANDRRGADGERLDQHLQPGTGAWSGSAGLNANLVVRAGTIGASLLGRWNANNRFGYHYGNALLYDLGVTSRERHGLSLVAQLNGRTADGDRLEDGSIGEHTGGTVVYASPGVRWNTEVGVTVEAGLQIPVYERLRGVQDEHTTARLACSLTP